MEGTIYNGTLSQPVAANKPSKRLATPTMTAPTAALQVGLAHLMHEINNPLQLVNNAVSLMEILMPKATGDPVVAKVFQELQDGVDQLSSLVVLLRSQLEGLWMISPSFESVNLSSIIEEILQSEAVRFNARGIRVAKEIAANLPPIEANEQCLKQAILNLLINAVDAMAKGGLFSVRAGAGERSVWLELSDTGAGIPPHLNVFQPFATSKPGGMGLGLAITRHIVETHGGKITYKSQAGRGTTFCLRFPWKTKRRICLLAESR
jgi:signal transduction histidine kinase